MKSNIKRIFAGLFFPAIIFVSLSISAQEGKTPRVTEVENWLNNRVLEFIKGRFPGVPALVSVNVDPLRRERISSSNTSSENYLPYYSSSTVHAVDEWDDPAKSIHELLPRIRRAEININLPSEISDEQLSELRDALLKSSGLVPGRDEIRFVRKNWQTDRLQNSLIYLAGIALLALLLGNYIVTKMTTASLSKTMASSSKPEKSGASIAVAAAPGMGSSSGSSGQGFNGGLTTIDGNLHFNDMVKINELISKMSQELAHTKNFPSLNDLIELDDLARTNPSLLGAILSEFPRDLQDRLFTISSDPGWLKAFVEPGRTNIDSYQLILNLVRRERDEFDADWNEIIILLWRLGPKLQGFLKDLPDKEALQILSAMPTSVSIPVAKSIFPGAWGPLLDPSYQPGVLPKDRILELKPKVLAKRHFNNLDMIESYRHEKGILEFLKSAGVNDERDIYEASKPDSTILMVRPPFYPVLNLSPDYLPQFLPH